MQNIEDFICNLRQTETVLANTLHQSWELDEDFRLTYNDRYLFDPQNRLIYISLLTAKRLGVEGSDLAGRHLSEIPTLQDYTDALDLELKQIFATGKKTTKAFKTMAAGHITRYSHISFKPLQNCAGTVDAVLCTVQDITRQKQLECYSQLQQEKFSKLMEVCPAAIITTDTAATINSITASLFDIIPTAKHIDLVGQHYSRFTEIFGLTYPDSILPQVLRGVTLRKNINIHDCWLQLSAGPLLSEDGSMLGAIIILHNVTEQEVWRQAAAKFDRLGLIGEMAAGVAHEIRNPMTVIRGYLQMFMSKARQEDLAKYNLVIEELDRVGDLIADYLSLARSEHPETNIHNLNDIIQSLCPLLKSEVLKNGVELKLQLDPTLPAQKLNEREMKQLILNLVRNGLEAATGKGCLSIQTASLGDMVELTIADNGCGIPGNLLPKIFDPFFTTKDTGTGLGLSVCAHIVQRHGGHMQVLSEQGLGTEFCITLPLDEDAPPLLNTQFS